MSIATHTMEKSMKTAFLIFVIGSAYIYDERLLCASIFVSRPLLLAVSLVVRVYVCVCKV